MNTVSHLFLSGAATAAHTEHGDGFVQFTLGGVAR